VLDVAELKHLLFKFLLCEHQLLCFCVKLVLHFIKVGVKLRD